MGVLFYFLTQTKYNLVHSLFVNNFSKCIQYVVMYIINHKKSGDNFKLKLINKENKIEILFSNKYFKTCIHYFKRKLKNCDY